MVTIYNNNHKSLYMSRESDKGKKSQIIDETEEVEISSTVEVSYIITTILDYYEATGARQLEEGEEWKKLDPDKYMSKGIDIPEDLDEEIKKTFIAQIKKFQK